MNKIKRTSKPPSLSTMKVILITNSFFLLILLASCVSSVPLNKQFYTTKKVGVIIKVDKMGLYKAGSQGLIEMALTPGHKFKDALNQIEPSFHVSDTLQTLISNILTAKNKPYEFVTVPFRYEYLPKFKKPNSKKKYSKKDFRLVKKAMNVDEILYVHVRYGILVSYYGVIELKKEGYFCISTETVDLSDNALLQLERFEVVASIPGGWKNGENHSFLKNSLETAADRAMRIYKTRF